MEGPDEMGDADNAGRGAYASLLKYEIKHQSEGSQQKNSEV